MDWPEWWIWEIELTAHVEDRMDDRGFTEVDLRRMLEVATSFREDVIPGRYAIETRHGGRRWEVIVEPDSAAMVIVVVTAFPAG